MTNIVINGGNKLEGVLPVFGAKNACLPIICASILAEETVELSNIPNLSDIDLLLELLQEIGCQTNFCKTKRIITIQPNIINTSLSDKANKMRASLLLLGPILAKKGEIKIPFPGGCSIGNRPIDITLDGFRALGVEFEDNENYLIATAPKGLIGAEFRMHFPSVTGTENLITAAATAKGTTIYKNIAVEPEIIDLIEMLNAMGADIKITGDKEVTINGVEKLSGVKHHVVPDRIITGSYAVLAALSAGPKGILIDNCRPENLQTELNVLKKAGVKIDITKNSIFVPQQTNEFTGVDFQTEVYGGFATDLQALVMLFLTQSNGQSHVTENIYENRFMHVDELNKMGAKITAISNHIAVVRGKTDLVGADVESTDLRASATLVIAGAIAKGQTIVHNIQHLDRGYETLDKFLANIGADIKRV